MEDVIYNFIHDHMMLHIVLIFIYLICILCAMLMDLISGVKKAIEMGKATTSTGYKRTIQKAQKYLSPFSCLVFIDLACSVIIPIPVTSMAWAAYCCFCEFKSVREKAWQKEELRKAERTMSVVIENKDEIAKVLAGMIFKTESKDGGTK